jgi:hypothetical protein
MAIQAPIQPVSQGKVLSTAANAYGTLRDSSDARDNVAELRARMERDGYVFLPGYLDRAEVLAARRAILERAAGQDALADGVDLIEGVLKPDVRVSFKQELTAGTPELQRLLFQGRMMAFFERYLAGEVRHFDFIWLRSVAPGLGTAPHGDSVFMNRGTTNLYTAWTPLGDIDERLGGLIVLENSHTREDIKSTYGQRDVDTYCEDDPGAERYRTTGEWAWNGKVSDDPVELREQLGTRWLTADYRMGDLLVFPMYTLHASLDNQTPDRLRLSTDTRYQLASEPVDERWVGEHPIAHGPDSKRSIIC